MKTLKKCKWEDIEINEVFAFTGCWTVLIKKTKTRAMVLESDHYTIYQNISREVVSYINSYNKNNLRVFPAGWGTLYIQGNYYKLSKSIQRIWKEE